MHGLVLSAVQVFTKDLYGPVRWARVMDRAGMGEREFEPMFFYSKAVGHRVLEELSVELNMPLDDILEDIGTYLVSRPNMEPVRRLLRFGGVTFDDFLHSLDDLPGRAKLAVPDLLLPEIRLREHSVQRFSLTCRGDFPGFGHVLVGILRTMADDYGALALVNHGGSGAGTEIVSIELLEPRFAQGRDFQLRAMVP
ncbi:heme NO-binding protein [Aliishimia ponticola]|uniref:Heme NO-binding protein n=1 Tax=Aliishimia ponticola TaxID=2499833 RepID=A0A4S4NCF6_9RHOB|nr:heme NO-binding domain-containing protein [Aliishimia ponticola]THH35721.1 heme NO-binding protein [Aliishimia ponticola]